MGLNISKIYNNEIYSDNLMLIAVKQGLKQRKLKKEDIAFLKKKAYIKDDEFGMNLLNMLPLSKYWRLPDTRTQAYLKRKRRESIPAKK